MRVYQTLLVGGNAQKLVARRVALRLNSPGTASFTIENDPRYPVVPRDLVVYDFGYAGQANMQRWFLGFVDAAVQLEKKRTRLLCRELTAALTNPLPLDLRHPTLRDVGRTIATTTGLPVVTPNTDYATEPVANFYNLGSGLQAVQSCGDVFGIDDFIWQQQAGALFLGSWPDSRWATVPDLQLPDEFFTRQQGSQSARLPALPQLRPGMRVRGHRLREVELDGSDMVVSWGHG